LLYPSVSGAKMQRETERGNDRLLSDSVGRRPYPGARQGAVATIVSARRAAAYPWGLGLTGVVASLPRGAPVLICTSADLVEYSSSPGGEGHGEDHL
jgi:hypothetical protein